jgi:hypothetical protein
MTPEPSDLTKKDDEPALVNDPVLGVDWGSNIDPGPGLDPREIKQRRDPDGRRMAV